MFDEAFPIVSVAAGYCASKAPYSIEISIFVAELFDRVSFLRRFTFGSISLKGAAEETGNGVYRNSLYPYHSLEQSEFA